MTLYGAFEITVIAALGGWALWLTATRVFKLKLGRQPAANGAGGGCGGSSGCGGCGSVSKGSCGVGSVTPPAPRRHH